VCSSPSIKDLQILLRSLVDGVKDVLFSSETTISDLQLRLVEGFINVEAHSVACSVLISVLILLSLPALAVPQLSVAFIARSVCVRPLRDDKFRTIFKGDVWISTSEVWFIMHGWALEACSGGGREVVTRLMVGSIVHHRPGTVTARSGVE